jgi:hypothetical protein
MNIRLIESFTLSSNSALISRYPMYVALVVHLRRLYLATNVRMSLLQLLGRTDYIYLKSLNRLVLIIYTQGFL